MKAVDGLDVVLDLSMWRKLAGNVAKGRTLHSLQRTCHDKRSVLPHTQGIEVCGKHDRYGVS